VCHAEAAGIGTSARLFTIGCTARSLIFQEKTMLRMLIAGALAAPALAFAQAPAKTADGVLTNGAGMTLYVFDRDSGGKSACNGQCASIWPFFAAGSDAKASGDYSVITRDDGGKQWAYKGKPLYTWSKDAKPGDKTGEGVAGMWHTAKP
jgi:predicted lipoprotein with Yx(FWY)xxD motif